LNENGLRGMGIFPSFMEKTYSLSQFFFMLFSSNYTLGEHSHIGFIAVFVLGLALTFIILGAIIFCRKEKVNTDSTNPARPYSEAPAKQK
jgi:hypothetical protein